MSRAERRASERRNRNVESRGLNTTQFVIMAIVTFAMIFSSFSYVLAYGGTTTAMIVIGVTLVMVLAVGVYYWLRNR